jgi:hypothetical protein
MMASEKWFVSLIFRHFWLCETHGSPYQTVIENGTIMYHPSQLPCAMANCGTVPQEIMAGN